MPTGFQVGPLYIRFYGIILMLGVVAGAFLANKEARRKGENGDFVWDALLWIVIGGILGARIWHILTPPPSMVAQGITTRYYLTHWFDAVAIWNGGLGIPGAVIGGVLALYIYCRSKKIPFLTWVDIIAPSLALGQAIGRWGNYVNQEIYGAPTDLPWGIFISPQNRLPEFKEISHYHPLFLYESIWNLANMFFLLWLSRRFADKLKAGDVFLVYLVSYPVGRFLLEYLRLDASQVGGVNANQTLMVVVALSAALLFAWRHRQERKTTVVDDTNDEYPA